MTKKDNNNLGFAITIIMIVIIGITGYTALNQFNKNVKWIEHTYEVINKIDLIEKLLYQAEAATRGYMITKNESYSTTYIESASEISLLRNDLKNLIIDNLEQVKRTTNLYKLLDEKFNFLETKVNERKNTQSNYNVHEINITSGRELTKNILAITEKMKSAEQFLLKQRVKSASNSRLTALWIIGLGTLINLGIVIYLISSIQKSFAQRSKAGKELKKSNQDLEALRLADQQRNWILTGANEINSLMRAANDLTELAEFVISGICKYMNVQLGGFYVLNDEATAMELHASYGFLNQGQTFALKEGLIGQAAYEQRTLVISDIPKNYTKIKSGTGENYPTHIIIIPIIYTDKVNGVIELAIIHKPEQQHIDFLEFVRKNIGSGINTGKLYAKMNMLNQRLQLQSEELQKQQEELQKQQEELKTTNEELISQSEALQASEEELRVQQEELQQINAELEEKAQLLKENNEALEIARNATQQKAEEVEQASRYKSEFLANMSHELRTPLNSILILAKLLTENKNQNLNDKQIEYANVIHKSGNDLLNLINDILDLSKIEAGKLDIIIEETNIKELAEDIHALFKEVANSKKIYFAIITAPNVPENIQTDKIRLEQIIRNLLSNAFKFTMPDGRITVEFSITDKEKGKFKKFSLRDKPGILTIKVRDTGIGIPKDKQELIFHAFRQADGSTNRKYGGTGLGLSISRQLADILGGEMQLESIENKGSTFLIHLPLQADTKPSSIENSIVISEEKDFTKEEEDIKDDRNAITPEDNSILIIEDDVFSAEILQRFAKTNNYKTIIALQGDIGLYYAKLYKPKAIILDIHLPIMDGYTVLKKLKEDPELASIPVHMISAMDISLANKPSNAEFSNKPLSKKDLEKIFISLKKHIEEGAKKILIIEDDPIHQEYLSNLILTEQEGTECKIAASLQEAKDYLSTQKADCIIADLKLSDAQGLEILKSLQLIKNVEQTPIIIYTARTVTPEEELEIRKYANTIILKSTHSNKRLIEEISLFLHHIENKQTTTQKQSISLETTNVLKGKKVLLVDDDMRNVFALTAILHQQDLNVVVASDGKESLQKLEEEKGIDIVLMDIMMPEMDGYEAMRHIRKQPKFKQLPIIALTAKAMKEDREKCIQAGASDYITKPVNTDQLLSLMRVWLYPS